MKFNKHYIILLTVIFSFAYSKSFLFREDYIDGYAKINFDKSDKIVAVLPFSGTSGQGASDYAGLYLGKYSNLDVKLNNSLSFIVDD